MQQRCLLFLIVFASAIIFGETTKTISRPLSKEERQHFQTLASAASDPNRYDLVTSALRKAAGVYDDTAKSKSLELESSVVTASIYVNSVISFVGSNHIILFFHAFIVWGLYGVCRLLCFPTPTTRTCYIISYAL